MVKQLDDLFQEASKDDFFPDKRKKVGGYVLGRTLGEGSFAKVRLGLHTVSKEKVAVKIVNKKLVERQEYVRKNMRREAAILQKLDHPNIARLYEILETDNAFYMALEYVNAGDMMGYLNKRDGISENEARRFMRQIVSALDHIHRSGVVHRDLKVENFLLDSDLNVKIIDFGLSNLYDGDLLSTQCGSPAYAAPEIFSKHQYGPAVDIWSVGVNLYAMVTGSLPFSADPPNNLTKLHAEILRGCRLPANLSDGCCDLLRGMLKVDETKRISMKDVMSNAWLNEEYIPLEPWDLQVKLSEEELNVDVVEFMTDCLDFIEQGLKEVVIQHKPSAATATYHLLEQRLDRGLGLPGQTRPESMNASRPSYKDCLRQLKEIKRKRILERRPMTTAIVAADAIDHVANVNKSGDDFSDLQLKPEAKSSTAVKRLTFTLKAQMEEESQKKEKVVASPASASELRALSNRLLQQCGMPSAARYKTTSAAPDKDPSHRLRILEMLQRYGTDQNTPPVPPNSAHAKAHGPQLPPLTPRDDNKKPLVKPDAVLNHKCKPRPRPVVLEREDSIPESSIDRFYDRYRFKVRNAEGDRMQTWDLRELDLYARVGDVNRSRMSPQLSKLRQTSSERLAAQIQPPSREGSKIDFKDLGISYTVPEHNTSIPRSRQRPPRRASLTTPSPRHSARRGHHHGRPDPRRPVHINSRELLYSHMRSRKPTSFSLHDVTAD